MGVLWHTRTTLTFRDLLEAKMLDQIEIEAAERGRAQQRGQIHEYR